MAADKVLNDLARRYIEKLPPVREIKRLCSYIIK